MKNTNITEQQKSNSAARFCYTIINIVLVLCYLVEVIKGSRSIGYFSIFALLALVPLVMTHLLYHKNPESRMIRYIISGGFGIFYLFTIFTTTSAIAYVYAMVLSLIFLVYNDRKLINVFLIGIIVGNLLQIAYVGFTGHIAVEELADMEIRVGSLAIFYVFMMVGTTTIAGINQMKIVAIEEEKERTADLMENILHISEKITTDIEKVTEKMGTLEDSASKTVNSMKEVTQGTNDTAESIQIQLEKTEQIQDIVQKVQNVSNKLEGNTNTTKKELGHAQENIDYLIERVTISNKENENVSVELSELSKHTNQMQSIIQMINEVTTQTSLLSLNASIEAARAGEAGRGFAVVASEISNLATQTQTATDNITTLIHNIVEELDKVVTVVEGMIQNSNDQNEAAHKAVVSFQEINNSIEDVYQESFMLRNLVDELTGANQTIVEGIERISAVTEEVTAHSNETLESSAENSEITSEVGQIIDGLNEMAQKLADH